MSIAAETTAVHVRAPGKINVYLAVGEPQDDGYHPLATVFQAVSLYEDVYAEHAQGFSVSVAGEGAHTVPTDDRNLAIRAARLLAAATGHTGGVHLDIHKSVPVAGGMAGGSADAAAALVACDALWQTDLSPAQLHELAARLGADVPFALRGGTAVGMGRGDRLTPALAPTRFEWVLVTAEQGLSTPEIYRRLDAHRVAHPAVAEDLPRSLDIPAAVLQALRAGDPHALAEAMHNDLELPAVQERPALNETLRRGLEAGALRGLVSGSGPTVALLCEDAKSAAGVQSDLAAAGIRSLRAHGSVPGARVMPSSA